MIEEIITVGFCAICDKEILSTQKWVLKRQVLMHEICYKINKV